MQVAGVSMKEIKKYQQQLWMGVVQRNNKNDNEYQLAKSKDKQNNNQQPIQYIYKTSRNIEVTPEVIDRLQKIQYLSHHENLLHLQAFGYKQSKFKGKTTEIYKLEQYLPNSQSLEDILINKKSLNGSSLNLIFYQIAKAMAFLQQNNMNHLRLNPSSILIKFPNKASSQNPLVRVSDIGISLQKNYHSCYCLHNDYFSNINPYECQYKNCIKYDLWAFAAIIYYSMKWKKPFYQKFFKFFQEKFEHKYLSAPAKWIFSNENNIDTTMLLGKVINKCWGINGQQIFENWNKVIEFFESEYYITRIQKISNYNIYVNHIRLIFILLKFSKFILQQCKQKLVSRAENSNQMQKVVNKISKYLVLIADCYHNIQFQKYFQFRCGTLSTIDRDLLKYQKDAISEAKTELQLKYNMDMAFMNDNTLDDYLNKKLFKALVKLQLEKPVQGDVQSEEKIVKFMKFKDELRKCCLKTQEVKLDKKKDRCEFLSVLYESEIIKNMANQFGFSTPQSILKIDI